MLIRMTHPRGGRPAVRQLDAIGRFSAIPAKTLIEQLEDCGNAATPGDQWPPDLIETYQIVDASQADAPDALSASARVAQALPHTQEDAVSVSNLASQMDLSDRSIRHGLEQLEGRVQRIGAGTRGDPHQFFIPATPDLQGLHEWNKQKGGTPMATGTNERGPPESSNGSYTTTPGRSPRHHQQQRHDKEQRDE